MSRNSRKKLLSSACMVAIFAATLTVALLASSRAWFASNQTVTADGMSIAVQAPEPIKAAVRFYDVHEVNGTTVRFNMDTETDAALPTYDMLDATTHYILMEIRVASPCTLTISTETTYRLDAKNPLLAGIGTGGIYTDPAGNTTSDSYSNWLSSIIFFEEVTPTDGDVTLSDGRQSFVKKADYSFDNTAISFEVGTESTYIVIGYDNDLMTKLYSENIGNDNLGSTDDIHYVNDCEFVLALKGDAS